MNLAFSAIFTIISFFYFKHYFFPFVFILAYLFLCYLFSLYVCLGFAPDEVSSLLYQLTLTDCYPLSSYFIEFVRQVLVLYGICFFCLLLSRIFPFKGSSINAGQLAIASIKSPISIFSINRSDLFIQSSILVLLIFHFLSSLFGPNLWINYTYLLLQKPESYAIFPTLAVIIVRASPFLSIYLAAFVGLSTVKKSGFPCIFLASLNLLYIFIFIQISGNSRYSVVVLFVAGLLFLKSKFQLRRVLGYFFLFVAPFVFIRTFFGRHGPQGLSQIFDYFRVFDGLTGINEYFVSTQFLFLSLFNSNYLGVVASFRGFYTSFIVNLVTLLPLPSGIFGAKAIKDSLYDNVITRVVPYPGSSQVLNSGLFLFMSGILFYSVMFFLVRRVQNIYSNTVPFFIVLFLSLLSYLISFQYPLRLSSRLSWASVILSCLLIFFQRRLLPSFYSPNNNS